MSKTRELRKKFNRNLKQKTNIYISCEGKTEKTYFESLNSIYKDVLIKAKYNKRTSAIDVVNNFNILFQNEDIDDDDLKFCVFDKDSNTQEQLNQALIISNQQNIQILFSNPCFEIWLYWHFESSRRNKTSHELKNYMQYKDGFSNYMNDLYIAMKLQDNLQQAITISKNSEISFQRDSIQQYSEESNPSTSVYNLLERIQKISIY